MFKLVAIISAIVFVLAVSGALVVSLRTHQQNQPEATEENKKEQRPKEQKVDLFDWWFPDSTSVFNLFLMVFTAILAAFTIWLASSTKDLRDFAEEQARDMKRSIEEARRSADAATEAAQSAKAANILSAKQFENGFKPWLEVKISKPFVDETKTPLNMFKEGEDKPRWIPFSPRIEIRNRADMPATIVWSDVWAQRVDSKRGETPYKIERGSNFKLFFVIGKGESFYPGWGSMRAIMGSDPNAVANFGAINLTRENRDDFMGNPPVIVGRIEYLDPLNKRRLLGFAFRPMAVWTADYSRWGGEEYNYDREISETTAPEWASELPY